ncbi:gp16 family protein [Tropicibacter sp. S64]|uniref:gp16 family protein n=1 Tax=Tropicibacter sp. S64 TaxID=3415122 RepID=UPI003C79D844
MTAALIRTIQVGCKQLGIDQDTRKALQFELVGKESLSEMSDAERRKVLDALKARGFKPSSRGGYKRAERGDIRLIHVFWKALGDAGKLKDPSRRGLNAFIRSRFGDAWGFVPTDVDQLGDDDKINTVLKALKDWVKRDVPGFDWGRIAR